MIDSKTAGKVSSDYLVLIRTRGGGGGGVPCYLASNKISLVFPCSLGVFSDFDVVCFLKYQSQILFPCSLLYFRFVPLFTFPVISWACSLLSWIDYHFMSSITLLLSIGICKILKLKLQPKQGSSLLISTHQ